MILELDTTDVASTEAPFQYAFMVDPDLIHVGGGSALVAY